LISHINSIQRFFFFKLLTLPLMNGGVCM